jgi:hypothetical protein
MYDPWVDVVGLIRRVFCPPLGLGVRVIMLRMTTLGSERDFGCFLSLYPAFMRAYSS